MVSKHNDGKIISKRKLIENLERFDDLTERSRVLDALLIVYDVPVGSIVKDEAKVFSSIEVA